MTTLMRTATIGAVWSESTNKDIFFLENADKKMAGSGLFSKKINLDLSQKVMLGKKEEKNVHIQLSDHFTTGRLLRFVLPSVIMMVCTSLYSIVDGFFVSNYAGKTPFAALNLIFPVLMCIAAIGFMLGTGGSAIVSRTLGQRKKEKANEYFTLMILAGFVMSTAVAILCFIFTPEISVALGAEGEMLENCIVYGRILFVFLPVFVLQNMFQNFFVTAQRPDMSLKVSLCSGVLNGVLDFVFLAIFEWGIAGAALATGIGQLFGGIFPLIYFSRENDSLLRLCPTKMDWSILWEACSNGISEMVSNLSMSTINILYNFLLMKMVGEDGVAAYGVIMYVNFVFTSIFIGYSVGSAPVIGYHYGAQNHGELHNLYSKSIRLLTVTGLIMTILAEVLCRPLVGIFVSYDPDLMEMTCHGFRLYSLMFLLTGVNIWSSAFFTALSNGKISAILSFLRTFVFQIGAVFLLPLVLDLNGIWLAVVAAEAAGLAVSCYMFVTQERVYHYGSAWKKET